MSTARKVAGLVVGLLLLLVVLGGGYLAGRAGIGSVVDPESLSAAERQFTERMAGASLVGRFTIAGREDRPARPERYDISSVEKVGEDLWRFNARMRYGDVDTTLPFVVPMRFAGDTPMISMTDHTIPASRHVQRARLLPRRPLFRDVAARRIRRAHVRHDRA